MNVYKHARMTSHDRLLGERRAGADGLQVPGDCRAERRLQLSQPLSDCGVNA